MATPTLNLTPATTLTPMLFPVTAGTALSLKAQWKDYYGIVVSQTITKFMIPSIPMLYAPPSVEVPVEFTGAADQLFATFMGRGAKRPKKGQLWPRTR